jgi:hypothetical protein
MAVSKQIHGGPGFVTAVTPVPNVQFRTPDDGQRKCPKHVEFYDRINLVN